MLREKIYGNYAVVYHRTKYKDLAKAILASGYNPGRGAMYGRGFYATYEEYSQDNERMKSVYGPYVLKAAVPLDGFLILDWEVFRNHPLQKTLQADETDYIVKQLDHYGIQSSFPGLNNYGAARTTSNLAAALTKSPTFPKKVRGIVFTGHLDGRVLLAYHPSTIIPLGMKKDGEEEYTRVEASAEYRQNVRKARTSDPDPHPYKIPSWLEKAEKSDWKAVIRDENRIVWKSGIWHQGIWKGDTWVSGTWESGSFSDGKWLNGHWLSGRWSGDVWEDGVWEEGIWERGTFKGGTWKSGLWVSGVWKGGTWITGKIYNPETMKLESSDVNPKEFFRRKDATMQESLLREKKDHLIKKLTNLTDEQKATIIAHLEQFPHKETLIDWNNKNLTWADFEPVLASTSKTQKLKQVKTLGIEGLEEGGDYTVLYSKYPVIVVTPHNYEASKLIASSHVAGCEGQWCTAYQKSDMYWKNYISRKGSALIYAVDMEKRDKMACHYSGDPFVTKTSSEISEVATFYNKEDSQVPFFEFAAFVFRIPRDKDGGITDEALSTKFAGKFPEFVARIIDLIEKASFAGLKLNVRKKIFTAKDTWESGKLDIVAAGDEWVGGTFKDGTWARGVWNAGVWLDGEWMAGTWVRGIWHTGVWYKGTWIRGLWKMGVHLKGTWKDGTWEDGIWRDGVWEDGIWEKGRWLEGVWLDGEHLDGEWNGGVWRNGVWKGGVFRDGIWSGGTWEGGTWEDGSWGGGYIVDPETKKSVYSRSNPADFYATKYPFDDLL